MIERFSFHCRAALVAAENEARLLNHDQIATEHVLLGLLRVEESVAAQALRLLGVTHKKAKRRIVRLVDVGPARAAGSPSFTPRVLEVIEDAFTGSIWLSRLGESLVGPAFEPTGEGVAASVLAQLGVDLEKAAAASLRVRCGPGRGQSFFELPFRADEWPPAPPKQN